MNPSLSKLIRKIFCGRTALGDGTPDNLMIQESAVNTACIVPLWLAENPMRMTLSRTKRLKKQLRSLCLSEGSIPFELIPGKLLSANSLCQQDMFSMMLNSVAQRIAMKCRPIMAALLCQCLQIKEIVLNLILKENEEHFDKLTLVELVANTRVNQALNIHPTTDAIAQRIDEEALKIDNDSRREFLESYDDVNSQIRLRRMASETSRGSSH